MPHADHSLSLTAPTTHPDVYQSVGVLLMLGGVGAFLVALLGMGSPGLLFGAGMTGLVAGAGLLYTKHARRPEGVDNDGVWRSSLTGRGLIAWGMGVAITLFYVCVYWFPGTLGGLIRTFDGLSFAIRGRAADQWFMYGGFYTLAVLVMGVRALLKYRHTPYQIVRTLSVMFFQLGFAFLLPQLLVGLQQPELYFHYFWPLDYDLFFPSTASSLGSSGRLGAFMLFWGAVLLFVATPVLTYFYGKRWYCSWVCGCGGLAETAGDPYRHLMPKSLVAWKIERWMVHGVLVFITVTTLLLWVNVATGGGVLGGWSQGFASAYGFYIGAVFSGVIGVGFYPLMGPRVWCRFGCPMAAILGIQQRFFSRFRITTNGGQCISCGNCSNFCHMGIDVKWYAQRGQNVIRASCVGCGMCATVCPRGVLRLENGPRETRFNGPALFPESEVGILPD